MFIGDLAIEREAGGFRFGWWRADPWGEAIEPHGHEAAHFMFAIGRGYRTCAEGETPSQRAALVFNPRQTFHQDRFEAPGGVFFSIHVPAARSVEAETSGAPGHPVRVGSSEAYSLVASLMQECAAWGADSPEAGEALCLELLTGLGRAEAADLIAPPWLAKVEARLRESLDEDTPLDELAADAGVHPYHLIRTFRRFHRCTPGRYRRRIRLQRAARLLTETGHPIVQIALACGFADQAHFSRRFREAFGFSPAAFRRVALG